MNCERAAISSKDISFAASCFHIRDVASMKYRQTNTHTYMYVCMYIYIYDMYIIIYVYLDS